MVSFITDGLMWTKIIYCSFLWKFALSVDLDLNLEAFCVGKSNRNYHYPNYCHAYITCSNGNGYLTRCNPADLVYEETANICDWPSDTFICTASKVASEATEATTMPSQSSDAYTSTSHIPEQSTKEHVSSTSVTKVMTSGTFTADTTISYAESDVQKPSTIDNQATATLHVNTDQNTRGHMIVGSTEHQSTTEIVSSSQTVKSDTINHPKSVSRTTCICQCYLQERMEFWNNETNQRLHKEQLPKRLMELKSVLSLNKTELTLQKTKLVSAPDDRVSAKAVGSLGVVLIVLFQSFVIVLDLIGVCQRNQLFRTICIDIRRKIFHKKL